MLKKVRLQRIGGKCVVFCKDMDAGVEFDADGFGEVGENTALDLLRDAPQGFKTADAKPAEEVEVSNG